MGGGVYSRFVGDCENLVGWKGAVCLAEGGKLLVMVVGGGSTASGFEMTTLGGNSGGITESSSPSRSQIVRFTMF